MAASFPGSIKTFSTKAPGQAIASSHINELQDEVTSIEDFLITKSAVSTIFKLIYPVGSIYMSSASTNPGTLFGGTWEAYGEGKVLVGKAASGTFDTAGATGGAETHTHPLSDAGVAKIGTVGGTNVQIHRSSLVHNWTSSHAVAANSTGTVTSLTYGAGLGGATDSDSTLQPYIVVYMWRRTA